MARNIGAEMPNMGGSPFPTSMGSQMLGASVGGLDAIGNLYQAYKRHKISQQPLGEFLGAKSPDDLPEGMRALYNTPIGKIGQLQDLLGGSLAPMMTRPQSAQLFVGAGGQFSATPQPGMTQVPGAKASDVVRAVKPPPVKPQAITPQAVSTLADNVIKSKAPGEMLKQIPGFGQNSLKSQLMTELANRGVDTGAWALDTEARAAYTKTINGPAFQNTLKFLQAVRPNMDTVIKLSDGIQRTFAKPLNRAQLAIMVNSGNTDAAAYAAAVTEVSDQVAKILQGGGTGSATSDAKLKQAQDILSKDFTPTQMKAVALTLQSLLQERENAMKTNTMQTIGNQTTPKKDPAVRFKELTKAGKSEDQAYKQMHSEGY